MNRSKTYALLGLMLFAVSIAFGVQRVVAFATAYPPFVVGAAESPGKIDPLDAYDSVSIDVIDQVVEGLYAYNFSSSQMEPIPRLAAEMGTWNADKTELTIKLRQNVTFHDGTKFNATAVKWNFDRLMYFLTEANETIAPASLYYQQGKLILNRCEIIDEYTVKYVLNFPSIIFEKLLAFSGMGIIKPNPAYEHQLLNVTDWKNLIGTGPFMIVDFKPGEETRFRRYENYYLGPANIKEMVFKVIEDDDTFSQAVLNHEIHLGGVLPEYLDQAKADPLLSVEPVKRAVVFYIQMNVKYMPLEIRKAAAYAFNYTYFLKEIRGGMDYELHVPIPDGMQYHNGSVPDAPYFNITKARELILELGQKDAYVQNVINTYNLTVNSPDEVWINVSKSSTPIATYNFTRYQSTTVERTATQLQSDLAKIGIKLDILDPIDWSQWVEIMEDPAKHKYLRFSFGGWGPDYNDPVNMIEPLYKTNASSNCFQLSDAELDAMLDQSYNVSGTEREVLFWNIQEHFVNVSVPSFYIMQRGGYLIYYNKVLSNVDDLKNIFGTLYLYNCVYTPEAVGIPGYNLTVLSLVMLGAAVIVILKFYKRR